MKKIFIITVAVLCASSCLHTVPGDLDRSFGNAQTGIVVTQLNRTAQINEVRFDHTGNIIAVGTTLAHIPGSFVARYTSEGILDRSFNKCGIQELYTAHSINWSSVEVLPNAHILVGGFARNMQTNCALAKYTSDGVLDIEFCPQKEPLCLHIGEGSEINSLAVTSDGNYIAGGACVKGSGYFMLLKCLSNGLPDNSFGDNGTVLTNFGRQGRINQIGIQPQDEKIVAVGYIENGVNTQFAVARYLPDGSLDESFGVNGTVSTGIEYYATARAIAFQPDNYIVVAGFTFDEATHTRKFALARYDTHGKLDPHFMGTGIVVTPIQYGAEAHAVAIQPDGKIILGGTSHGNRCLQFTLVRYNSDGSLDKSFGNNGIISHSSETYDACINSIILQNDTKLIVAGYAGHDILIARYFI